MKAWLAIILLAIAQVRGAGWVSLAWEPSPEATGYVLYAGTNSGDYKTNIAVGKVTSVRARMRAPGVPNFFAVKATNEALRVESDFSNEAMWVPKLGPSNLVITVTATILSTTNLLDSWAPFTNVVVFCRTNVSGNRFFRPGPLSIVATNF